MPGIDVSYVLRDQMIAGERFQVVRRQETVNSLGISTVKEITLPALGSITPTGDNSLVRAEGYQQQAKTIRVITNFRLRGATIGQNGANYQPDIVLWNGSRFVVRTVDDYSQYGAGMIVAECSSIELTDPAPFETFQR